MEVMNTMARRQKDPSKRGVSAASVKGNSGPKFDKRSGRTQTTNQQYGADNTQGEL
jgi:hypothetical protein